MCRVEHEYMNIQQPPPPRDVLVTGLYFNCFLASITSYDAYIIIRGFRFSGTHCILNPL